jgi:putative hydrolase of the HAD superfamily
MTKRLPEELHAEVRKMVLERETEMPAIAEMYPVVEALKQNGYGIYLLSNCPDWFDEFKKSVPAFAFFDGFIISAYYNEIKPDEKLYKILFEKFSLKPEECFFIDDMQANIDTARHLGMTAHCFADRNFERLKAVMKQNEINI